MTVQSLAGASVSSGIFSGLRNLKMYEVWTNDRTNLWYLHGGEWKYSVAACLKNIEWGSEIRTVCAHCGSEVVSVNCPNCGAVERECVVYKAKDALAYLTGPLPHADFLFWLMNDTVIEIRYAECGPRDDPENGEAILRLSQCEIVDRQIPSIMANEPREFDILRIDVEIKCEAQLLTNEISRR